VLRRSHAEFAAAPPIAGGITIDSTDLSVAEVTACIRSVLDQPHPANPSGDGPLFSIDKCCEIAHAPALVPERALPEVRFWMACHA
jgi:hypothetical protein